MRKPSLMILAGLAFLVWIVCVSGEPLLLPVTQTNSNLTASTVFNELEVVVLFEGKAPIPIHDIEQQAINALSTNGQPVAVTNCGISLVVSERRLGGAAILQDLPKHMLYKVEFVRGVATVTYAGPERHRTPRFGEKAEDFQKDAAKVKVKPE